MRGVIGLLSLLLLLDTSAFAQSFKPGPFVGTWSGPIGGDYNDPQSTHRVVVISPSGCRWGYANNPIEVPCEVKGSQLQLTTAAGSNVLLRVEGTTLKGTFALKSRPDQLYPVEMSRGFASAPPAPPPVAQTPMSKSYSDERCKYDAWAVKGAIRNMEGPCYFAEGEGGLSFMREGVIMRGQLWYTPDWRDAELHLTSCAQITRTQIICGVTFFGESFASKNPWYAYGLRFDRSADGRYRLARHGNALWVGWYWRYENEPGAIIPDWSKQYVQATHGWMGTGASIPSPRKATGK